MVGFFSHLLLFGLPDFESQDAKELPAINNNVKIIIIKVEFLIVMYISNLH